MEEHFQTEQEKKIISRRRIQIAVLSCGVVLFCLLSGVIALYLYVYNTLEKLNYVEDPKEIVLNTDIKVEETEETLEGTFIDQEQLNKINQALQDNLTNGLVSSSHVVNILLVGTDRRVTYDWAGNSDSMILVSINNNSKEITLTSIMRDTYVTIPDYGNYKVNLAHALGGPAYLKRTIEANFGIDISYYASVNFASFISIVDILGGIPMYVSPAEVRVANKYIDDMFGEGDITEKGEYLPEEGGNLYLTGTQALAFSRIRYVGNSDYERTERQRRVLNEIVKKAKKMSWSKLNRIINAVTPYVTHNIPTDELMNLVLMVPTLLGYEMISDRIPYDGMYQMVVINDQDMLVPDWPQTIATLYSRIYRNVSQEDLLEDAQKHTEAPAPETEPAPEEAVVPEAEAAY